MKKQTKSNWQNTAFAFIASVAFVFAFCCQAAAQKDKFKVGDRVECDTVQIGKWEKGTILPYGKYDNPETANFYRFSSDRYPSDEGTICFIKNMRLLANETTAPKENRTNENGEQQDKTDTKENDQKPKENNRKDTGKLRVDENNTVLADRELLDCDNIEQKPTKNGARPDAKLLEKLIRCLWERPAEKGLDGARTVDLTPLQIGSSRKWIPYRDIGSGGTPDTLVWAVKTTYTWRTFHRTRIYENVYVGVFNCYVNTFGEWQCGSADSKQKGETKEIPVQQ